MSRRAAIWALGALLGIVVTAAITWGASRLTSQHIGLSSEPLSAGRSLAPRPASEPAPTRATTTTTTVTRTRTMRGTAGASPASTTTSVVTQTRSSRSVEIVKSSTRHARDDGGSRGEGGAASGGPEGGAGRGSGGRAPDD